MVIFMLGQCSLCGSRYAIAPDVTTPDQWLMFERKPAIHTPSHLCQGGLLCINGHPLEITAQEAVLTTDGRWLALNVAHMEPVLN
jgi:hypothetical protein